MRWKLSGLVRSVTRARFGGWAAREASAASRSGVNHVR